MASSAASSSQEFKRLEPLEFFRQHVNRGVRPDGRTNLSALRPVSLSVGSVTAADGSALLKQGKTLVSCGITLELAKPKAEEPDKGFVVANVDLPPLCHSRFKPGPPPDEAQAASKFLLEVLDNSGLLQKSDLCIVEGRLAWVLNIDVVCLNHDGNINDAALKTTVAALRNLTLPKVTLIQDEEEATAGNIRVDVEHKSPLMLHCTPVACTAAFFDGQLLLDPTDEEETLAAATITVVLNADSGELVHCTVTPGDVCAAAASRETVQKCVAAAKKQTKKIAQMLEKAAPMNRLL